MFLKTIFAQQHPQTKFKGSGPSGESGPVTCTCMSQTGVSLSPDSQKAGLATSLWSWIDPASLFLQRPGAPLVFHHLQKARAWIQSCWWWCLRSMVSWIDPESTLAHFFGYYLRTTTSTKELWRSKASGESGPVACTCMSQTGASLSPDSLKAGLAINFYLS